MKKVKAPKNPRPYSQAMEAFILNTELTPRLALDILDACKTPFPRNNWAKWAKPFDDEAEEVARLEHEGKIS